MILKHQRQFAKCLRGWRLAEYATNFSLSSGSSYESLDKKTTNEVCRTFGTMPTNSKKATLLRVAFDLFILVVV